MKILKNENFCEKNQIFQFLRRGSQEDCGIKEHLQGRSYGSFFKVKPHYYHTKTVAKLDRLGPTKKSTTLPENARVFQISNNDGIDN